MYSIIMGVLYPLLISIIILRMSASEQDVIWTILEHIIY